MKIIHKISLGLCVHTFEDPYTLTALGNDSDIEQLSSQSFNFE